MAREWLLALSTKRRANPHHKIRPTIAAQTMRNALHLVRVAFEDAIEAGLLEENVWAGLKVKRSRTARTTESWTVLRPEEQKKLLAKLRPPERWLVAIAMGTCIRRSEQWSLRLADVHLDLDRPHLVIRFGGSEPGLPTKGGRVRRVYLFGMALEAMWKWVEAMPREAMRDPKSLVFPRADGQLRKHTPAKLMRRIRRAVGRLFRWKDFRHTGATSLHLGWWGTKWPLDRVQRLLGHASIITTQRYVHWVDEEGLAQLARDTEEAMDGKSGNQWSRGGSNQRSAAEQGENPSPSHEIASPPKGLIGVAFDGPAPYRELAELELEARREGAKLEAETRTCGLKVGDRVRSTDTTLSVRYVGVVDSIAGDMTGEGKIRVSWPRGSSWEDPLGLELVVDADAPLALGDRVRAVVRDAKGAIASHSKYVGDVRHVYREGNDWRAYVTWDAGGSLETTCDRLAKEAEVQDARLTDPEPLGQILARAGVTNGPSGEATDSERFAAKRIAREVLAFAHIPKGDSRELVIAGMVQRELVSVRESYAAALREANRLCAEMADNEARALVKLRLASGALRDVEKANVRATLRELEREGDASLILSTSDRLLEELGRKGRER